jgi:uncharacterized OsmC-like protein
MYRQYEHGTTRYPGHRLVFRGYPAELTVVEVASLPGPYQVKVPRGQNAGVADTVGDGAGGSPGPRPQELLEAAPAICITITARDGAGRAGLNDTHVVVTVACDREESATDSPLPPRAGPGT